MGSRLATLALVLGTLAPATSLAQPRSEIRVPGDVPALQLPIQEARPGDTIVLEARLRGANIGSLARIGRLDTSRAIAAFTMSRR